MSVRYYLAAAVVLIATPAIAQAPGTGGIDLESIVLGLVGVVNVPVLVMLTVIAFAFHRIQAISAGIAIAAPILVGALLGALSAVTHAQQSTGGWIPIAGLLQSMLEGSIINGGMAVVLGRMSSVGLEKLWPSTPPAGT